MLISVYDADESGFWWRWDVGGQSRRKWLRRSHAADRPSFTCRTLRSDCGAAAQAFRIAHSFAAAPCHCHSHLRRRRFCEHRSAQCASRAHRPAASNGLYPDCLHRALHGHRPIASSILTHHDTSTGLHRPKRAFWRTTQVPRPPCRLLRTHNTFLRHTRPRASDPRAPTVSWLRQKRNGSSPTRNWPTRLRSRTA